MNQAVSIPPFWHKLPFFFLYGLRPAPLALNLSLAIIVAMAGLSLFGVILLLVFYFVMLKYSFSILEDISTGKLDPPALSYEVLVEGYELPAKLYFLIILFFTTVGGLLATVGWLPALALLLFGLLAFPAAVMALAATHSIFAVMNPVVLVEMIRCIGWPYLALYGLLSMLTLAESNVKGMVSEDMPLTLLLPLYNFINVHFSMATFAMMGYVLLQFHEELGESTPSALVAQPEPGDLKFSHFERHMAEGNTDAAKMELQDLIREDPCDMQVRRRYHDLLGIAGTPEELKRHAVHYLPLLLDAGDARAATEVLTGLGTEAGGLELKRPESYRQLMTLLRTLGRGKLAVKLAGGFHKRFEGSPEIPGVYLLAGRILCEDLDRDDLAERPLEYVARNFPGRPEAAEADSLLGLVRRIRSA